VSRAGTVIAGADGRRKNANSAPATQRMAMAATSLGA
jgi:hypothetical protein